MRELGVVSYDGILLGPPPRPDASGPAQKEDPQRERRDHYQTLLNRPVGDEELKMLP